MSVAKRLVPTHRLALWVWRDIPVEADYETIHTCDNPPCCNPDHLLPGTHQQNMADMKTKGRRDASTMPKGSAVHNALLDEASVREIKRRLDAGETAIAIASDYSVKPTTIQKIKAGKNWGHV